MTTTRPRVHSGSVGGTSVWCECVCVCVTQESPGEWRMRQELTHSHSTTHAVVSLGRGEQRWDAGLQTQTRCCLLEGPAACCRATMAGEVWRGGEGGGVVSRHTSLAQTTANPFPPHPTRTSRGSGDVHGAVKMDRPSQTCCTTQGACRQPSQRPHPRLEGGTHLLADGELTLRLVVVSLVDRSVEIIIKRSPPFLLRKVQNIWSRLPEPTTHAPSHLLQAMALQDDTEFATHFSECKYLGRIILDGPSNARPHKVHPTPAAHLPLGPPSIL
jgi:hypothetical protein